VNPETRELLAAPKYKVRYTGKSHLHNVIFPAEIDFDNPISELWSQREFLSKIHQQFTFVLKDSRKSRETKQNLSLIHCFDPDKVG